MGPRRSSLVLVFGMLGIVTLLIGLEGGTPGASRAAALTVCPTGAPQCAYGTVQEAIDAAQPGDVVQISTGLYTDVHSHAGLTQTVLITKSLTLRGGYSTDFADWDPQAFPTTLDAQGLGRVLCISGPLEVLIEGVRITGGDAGDLDGGGIAILSATATLSASQITGNSARTGGGLFAQGAHVRILETRVTHNEATEQGGGVGVTDSILEIEASPLISNTAFDGGGLYLLGSAITVTNSILAQNQAQSGGCALSQYAALARMIHTTVARNAGPSCAGLYVASLTEGEPPLGGWAALTNTILVSHTVGISAAAGNTVTLQATLWGTATWANDTDWEGAGQILTGTTNFWALPGFVDADTGDFHILEASAAREKGIPAGIDRDIDGEPRPFGAGFDLGADEFHGRLLSVFLPQAHRNLVLSTPTPEPGPTATVTPTVAPPTPVPPEPEGLLILDRDDNPRDWLWLQDRFGPVTIQQAPQGIAYRICLLQEIEGPSSLGVRVTHEGIPLQKKRAVRYWPDAPFLPPEMVGWTDRGVYALTKVDGTCDFAMGGGDYYFPPNAGASAIWIWDPGYPSDFIQGLGMLGLTNHIHLDVQFCLRP